MIIRIAAFVGQDEAWKRMPTGLLLAANFVASGGCAWWGLAVEHRMTLLDEAE